MSRLIIIFILGILAGCNTRDKVANGESNVDSTIISFDTTIILGEEYRGFGTNKYKLFVLNSKGDTVLYHPEMYFDFEFYDFNGDSLKDIIVHPLTNIPGIQYLFLFDKNRKSFMIVSEFEKFPDPKPIQGTDCYYSYHRSGCADNFWDSDLFYIDKFEACLLANVSGNECEGEKGIVVSKAINGEQVTIEKFTLDILEKYEDHKWGFIADYWTKNYSRFVE